MCCGLIFFQIFFYRVGFKLIHLSLESDSVNYQCNKYCVTRKHCGGGDCGWLWGSGHCHFYGCRKKQAVRGSSSDLGYMYMIRGSRKKFRGWGWEWESVPDKPPPPPLLFSIRACILCLVQLILPFLTQYYMYISNKQQNVHYVGPVIKICDAWM